MPSNRLGSAASLVARSTGDASDFTIRLPNSPMLLFAPPSGLVPLPSRSAEAPSAASDPLPISGASRGGELAKGKDEGCERAPGVGESSDVDDGWPPGDADEGPTAMGIGEPKGSNPAMLPLPTSVDIRVADTADGGPSAPPEGDINRSSLPSRSVAALVGAALRWVGVWLLSMSIKSATGLVCAALCGRVWGCLAGAGLTGFSSTRPSRKRTLVAFCRHWGSSCAEKSSSAALSWK
mmetsp:Transcript_12899/g.30776  ORF Transcript_12899/g.30776 Transcript_12899/m.30776 type:complete len:237 (-) Transcript_12899:422-1132(-)